MSKTILDESQWQTVGTFNVESGEMCMVSSALWPKDGVQFLGCVPGAHRAWTSIHPEKSALLVCQKEYQPWTLKFEALPFLMNVAEHRDIGLWCMFTYDELVGMEKHELIVEDAQTLIQKSDEAHLPQAGTVNYGAILALALKAVADDGVANNNNNNNDNLVMLQSFVAFDEQTGEIAAIYLELMDNPQDTNDDYDEDTTSVSTALSSYYTTVVCSRKFYQDLMKGV
jgi:hypothetical protein